MMTWLAARLDTFGAAKKQREAHSGWPSKTRQDIQFVRCGGVQFRYRERGKGQPIVFTADPPVTLESYDELLERYSTRFRVIVFELPAMGFSHADVDFDFRFQALNDSIAAFLSEVVGQPAALAFSCVAGLAAVDIARRHPTTASHLIQIQCPSWTEEVRWKKSRDPKNLLGTPFVGQLLMKKLRVNRAKPWLTLSVGRKDLMPALCSCAQASVDHGAGWHLATIFQSYLTDESPPFSSVNTPTLAIWGDLDGSHQGTDRASSLWMSSGHKALVTLDHVGHFPELEDINGVYDTITEFVDAH